MDHHEQHHQHHQQQREKRIEQDQQWEKESERSPGKIHPTRFLVLGTLLVAIVVLTWLLL